MPTARAAQGLVVLLFLVFLMLGGAGPPPKGLLAVMRTLFDVVPLTHAGRVVRGPRLGLGWDGGAVSVMLGLLVAASALTVWRFRRLEM